MDKRPIRCPIAAFFFLSIGGLLLHYKIHPPEVSAYNYIPLVAGIASSFLLPVMFYYGRTARWAWLINWIIVVVGTVTMAHFSLDLIRANWDSWQPGFRSIVLQTTLPDILILFAKIPLGRHILRFFLDAEGQS